MPDVDTSGASLDGFALTPTTLPQLIEVIRKRFTDDGPASDMAGKDAKLLDKLHRRSAMFYALESQNPTLREPFNEITPYQTDKPRQLAHKLVARLRENPFTVRAHLSKDVAAARASMNAAEEMMNSGIYLAMERNNLDLQGALAFNQAVYGLGIIHWNRNPWIWPSMPEREYVLELPKDKEERKRYEKAPAEEKEKGAYRETSKSLLARNKSNKAQAGFPYYLEAPDPQTFMWVEDRSLDCGLGMVLIQREVGLLEYDLQLWDEKKGELALSESTDIPMGREKDAPLAFMPSSEDWGNKAMLYQLWTRDEFYEVLANVSQHSSGANSWRVTKATKHSWGMPPFALVAGFETYSSDPSLRYEPALEGLYRLKPAYDRLITLYNILAEQTALPEYIVEQTETDSVPLSEDGADVDMSRDSSAASMLPPGAKLRKMDFNIGPAIVDALRLMGEQYKEAEPDVGDADYGTTTAAWAIRLQQSIRNIGPSLLLRNIAKGINICVRSIAKDIAEELGEGVYTYLRLESGRVDYDTLVGIEPEDIRSLDFIVDINPTSAAEQITKQEHGASLLLRGFISKHQFYEDYLNISNPDEHQLSLDVEQIFEQYYKPGITIQYVNAKAGTDFVLGADGKIVALNGQKMTPEQVLQTNGQQPMVSQVTPQAGGQQGPASAANQVSMSSQEGMNTPGTMPMNGMQ